MFLTLRLMAPTTLMVALLASGCTTSYHPNETVRLIAIAQPENPRGQIQPVMSSSSSPATGAGLTGALVKGFEEGRAEAEREKAGDIVIPTGPFLSDQKIELGTALAAEAAEDLKAVGYTVVSNQAPNAADAILSFEFLQVNFMRSFGTAWHPQIQVKATLTRMRDSSVLFQRTYFYSDFVHSMWDEAIEADAKYDAETAEMFRDHDKLLIDAYSAGIAKIAQHLAASLAKH